MIYFVLIISMIFCHIVDDYYLQGCLAKMKQKKWWEENYPDKKYKNDFYVALICHSISWSFMIHLPLMIFSLYEQLELTIFFCLSWIMNMLVHLKVDHLKANELKINLWQDQIIHFAQIVITFIVFIIVASS